MSTHVLQHESAGAAMPLPVPPPILPEKVLGAGQWGMIAFLVSEAAFFCTLIATYLFFMGKDTIGPTPEVLSLPMVVCTTILLLSSSATIHLADRELRAARQGRFCLWWALTIVLGVLFLVGTGLEWRELMEKYQLTLSRNLFGTTYYTLVGFHALHVSAGVIAMSVVLLLGLSRYVSASNATGAELVSWYWHFVDGVWIVVFTVVYLISR